MSTPTEPAPLAPSDLAATVAAWRAHPDAARPHLAGTTLCEDGERLTVGPALSALPTSLQWRAAVVLFSVTGTARGRTRLFVDDSRGWTDLAPVADWTDLDSLCLHGAGDLTDLSALSALPALEYLGLHDAARVTALPTLADTFCQLELSHAAAFTTLPPADALARLTQLELRNLPALSDTSALSACSRLRFAALEGLSPDADVGFLGAWTAVKELELDTLAGLTSLAALSGSTALSELSLHRLPHLHRLDGVLDLPALTRLRIDEVPLHGSLTLAHPALELVSVCGVDPLETLVVRAPALEELYVQSGDALTRFEWHGPTPNLVRHTLPRGIAHLHLTGIAQLETLSLEWCDHLVLADLPALRSIRIQNTVEQKTLDLRNLPRLEAVPELHSEEYHNIVLEDLPAIEAVRIRHSGELNRIRVFRLPNLRCLDLHGSGGRLELRDVPALTHLDLHGRRPGLDPAVIESLDQLEFLDLSKTRGIPRLDLTGCPRLTTVRAHACEDLEVLVLPSSVTTLDVHDAPQIRIEWPAGGAPETVRARCSGALPAVDTWPTAVPIGTLDLDRCLLGPCPVLPALTVRTLRLHDWYALEDLRALDAIVGLEVLVLTGSHKVTDLSPLARHGALRELRVSRAHAEVAGLPDGVVLQVV